MNELNALDVVQENLKYKEANVIWKKKEAEFQIKALAKRVQFYQDWELKYRTSYPNLNVELDGKTVSFYVGDGMFKLIRNAKKGKKEAQNELMEWQKKLIELNEEM